MYSEIQSVMVLRPCPWGSQSTPAEICVRLVTSPSPHTDFSGLLLNNGEVLTREKCQIVDGIPKLG